MVRGNGPKFIIVGGGLGGAVMANYLGKAGYDVELYEKRPDPRGSEAVAGRSINLALSIRGLQALREIDVEEEAMREAVRMEGRVMHDPTGNLSYQPYGKPGQAINSVSRGDLNIVCINSAERYGNVALFFDHKCVDLDLDTATAQFEVGNGASCVTVKGDIVIGADGAFSAVRHQMQRLDRFDYSISYLKHGYKELVIPPAEGGGFRMEKNALHIWPRRAYMMIALPNADGSYTVTCFWRHEGQNSFANLKNETDVVAYFREHFPDAVALMPTLATDYFENPTGSLGTVRCGPWFYEGKAVLLGDAAHAVVPFYGQGMNAAFEDCTILNECILNHGPDWQKVFEKYYELRKANADAIADLALQNFIEMRDHVGSTPFLWKKRFEKFLNRLLPNWYIPLYTMVSFSRIPYAEAVRRSRMQNRTIQRCAAVLVLLILGPLLWLVF